MSNEYLNDKSFLKELDSKQIRNQYAKITLLDWNENYIQDIEGVVTSGSINIDGSSSMRRTGNISIISNSLENNVTNINNPFSVNKKIKIQMGIYNTTDKYTSEKIIWFPLGIFVITGCSLSRDVNNLSLNIQFKDKMCLLNGDCGGTLPSSITFNEVTTTDENGDIVIENPTIFTIIQELVNHWGNEQLGNIIISDLSERILQVVKWSGSTDLYVTYQENKNNDQGQLNNYVASTVEPEKKDDSEVTTYTFGDDIGYVYTDFVYTDDLVCSAGDSITSVLDKIIEYIGNYEYFYNLDGQFVFQEKKNYLNTSQVTDELLKLSQEEYDEDDERSKEINLSKLSSNNYKIDMTQGKSCYDFTDSSIITSYSNTPNYTQIKNDFVVWGERSSGSDKTVPIKYHLAIDSKPSYNTYENVFRYYDQSDGLTYYKSVRFVKSKEELDTLASNGEWQNGVFYCIEGENTIYKLDTANNEKSIVYEYDSDGNETENKSKLINITSEDYRTELYLQGCLGEKYSTYSNYYFTELEAEWPKLYNIEEGSFKYNELNLKEWTGIDYFLDFIDSESNIGEYCIDNIGRRTKVLTDDSINCIFEPKIDNVVYLDKTATNIKQLQEECEKNEMPYSLVTNEIYEAIYGGGKYNSAFVAMQDLLYQYTNYNESITIQCLPIYYLEPNTRITVNDTKTNINGDFIINSISFNLDTKNTMTINATKALEKI